MPPASAQPLKVTPSTPQRTVSLNKKVTGLGDPGTTPTQTSPASGLPNPGTASTTPAKAGDISSPHELTAFVENLLEQLETRFDDMSTQILDRMTQMSSRVDALEASIQDILNSDVTGNVSPGLPPSPSPSSGPNGLQAPPVRRTGSSAI